MLLLDTCILRFWTCNDPRLGRKVRRLLEEDYVPACISMETIRELIVDWNGSNEGSGNELRQRWSSKQEMIHSIQYEYGVKILPVDMKVMQTYSRIIPSHTDPSDHIIIAHAITTGFTLVSKDTHFPEYVYQGLDLMPNI